MKPPRTLPHFSPIEPSAPAEREVHEKAIYWPGHPDFSGDETTPDLSAFPTFAAMKARASARPPSPLAAFAKAVRDAQDRVLIMDRFLFTPEHGSAQVNVDAVIAWFSTGPAVSDVRLLTSASGEEQTEIARQFSKLAMTINSNQSHRASRIDIRINFNLKGLIDEIHDRFAIIDNELWHFGATVGGLHPSLNAASRGWPADKHGAIAFFESAWRAASTESQRHDKGRPRA